MFSKALRTSCSAPLRRSVISRASIAKRTVTTDAASAHAEAVPEEDDKPFQVTLSDESFETYELDPPPYALNTTKKELKKMYYDMVQIRRMEMSADRLYKEKKIRGFCHLSTGQEAVAVGIEHSLTKEDDVITSYRCHGFALMRGGTVKSIIGELLGRREGIAYGKGGSMHMFSKGFYGGNGIVGAQVPVGAGLAFAHKYQDKKTATVCLYGDGASNQGQVFEAFNMAKLWNLPVLFGCENNKYGMGTAANRSSALTDYYKRGQYIPGLKVNGMDVLAVKAAVKYGKEWTESGHGPLVLEYVTYRYGGHSMSDPGTTYRTREEIQRMRSTQDPIAGLKQKLLEWNVCSEDELKNIDKEARAEVDKEVAEAEAMLAPEPTPRILFEDIYFSTVLKLALEVRFRARTMQVPLWIFIAAIAIALSWHEMASILFQRAVPTLSEALSTTIRGSPALLRLTRLAPQFPFISSLTPQSSTFNILNNQQRAYASSAKMAGPVSSATLEAIIKNRRTYYALDKSSTISNDKIQEIVKNAVLHVPSSFNFQPVRVVVLFGAEHDKFWEAVKAALKPLVPDATAWAASEARVNGFKAGYGSVLFFESKKVTQAQQEKFPLYAAKFPLWTAQSDAMHQYAVWLGLEAEGLGANLQHYNPLIDEFVQKTWGIDADWELNAQLVFGTPIAGKGPAEKQFQPLEDRYKVFGAIRSLEGGHGAKNLIAKALLS
ncbi:hypothetical protein B7463_g6343, partial [Scytalidium lignicola]